MIQEVLVWLLGKELMIGLMILTPVIGIICIATKDISGDWPWQLLKR